MFQSGREMEARQALWDLFALGHLAQETRDVLADGIKSRDIPLPADKKSQLSNTLDHLGHVREGFVLCLRTSSVTSLAELRGLVDQVLLDWSWLEESQLSLIPPDEVEVPRLQVLAFAHSYVTLALLPKLPPSQVTFPQERRTYADIPIPRTPGEVLSRIEELETVVWEAVLEPLGNIASDPLRRTYGFFETSAWLISTHMRRFFT